jgi:uncharacterized protein YprB with RNaseH-like and TPR domain
MYDCWRRRLYGGLKTVEQRLGIARKCRGLRAPGSGTWWRYVRCGDDAALETLLAYNREGCPEPEDPERTTESQLNR